MSADEKLHADAEHGAQIVLPSMPVLEREGTPKRNAAMASHPVREQLLGHGRALLVSLSLLSAGSLASHAEPLAPVKPKLGPHATPIQEAHDYIRMHKAPDYWALSPYYVPQYSGSACSVASIATALNALRGMPMLSHEPLVTQSSLLAAVGDPGWEQKTAENGEGVSFTELQTYVERALDAHGIQARTEVFRPRENSAESLAQLRAVLSENEHSDEDVILVYFNQGVVTGDWDGPHVSPVGAYDRQNGRVLIMDVDRLWYGPYWTSDEKLLEAMLRPTPAHHGRLAGETGGVVRIARARPARLN